MDLMKLGTQLLAQKLGANASSDTISNALGSLLNQQQNQQQDAQQSSGLSGLVSSLSENGGMAGAVQSWLGDGDNEAISGDQLEQALGSDQISNFAAQLGVDQQTASNGLAEALPQLIDQSSSGGNLLEKVGGIGGVLNMAKKLFG